MKPTAQLVCISGLLLLIFGLAGVQLHWFRDWFAGGALGQRELATRMLGEYLAREYAGKRAIILSNPFSIRPGQPGEVYRFEKAGLRGLRHGLGKAVKIDQVVYPEIRPDFFVHPKSVRIAPGTTTPLSYLMTPGAVDHLAEHNPDAELMVSLIGLPQDIRESRTWSVTDLHKFALLLPDLRVVGEREEVLRAVRSRKIAAMVFNRPGGPSDDVPMGKDLKMEFEQRFILVTPETLEQVLRAYPRLL